MKQQLAVVPVIGAVLVLGLTGCGGTAAASSLSSASPSSTVSPAHPIHPAIPSPVAIARAEAKTILASAILPADAQWVTAPPPSAAKAPFERSVCGAEVGVHRFAIIRNMSIQSAVQDVVAAAGSRSLGYGVGGDRSGPNNGGVTEKTDVRNSLLSITLTSSPDGDIAVRVDAMVGARFAKCIYPGAPMMTATSSPKP